MLMESSHLAAVKKDTSDCIKKLFDIRYSISSALEKSAPYYLSR